MTSIYRYQPAITPGPNGTDFRPHIESSDYALTELATLDGWRYVAVPNGAVVIVPEEIETWEPIIPTDELRAAIKETSAHCQLARDQFIARVRARFTLDDELYFARIATGALMGTYELKLGEADELAEYQQHVEACRETLHDRYAELGL